MRRASLIVMSLLAGFSSAHGETADIAAPIWLNPQPPLYSQKAYAAKLEGRVTVEFDVTETGTTTNVHILETTAPGVFDSESIADVEDRLYQPVTIGGQAQYTHGLTTVIDYKLADAVLCPKLTHFVKPVYPGGAQYSFVDGFCAMDLSIADDGSVSKAVVYKSYPFGVFEQSCVDAVKEWKFEAPADLGGPTAQHFKYMIHFRMRSKPEGAGFYLNPGQWVELEYTLTTGGRTKDVAVVGQSEPGLPTWKAAAQVRKMKFNPVVENGVPVEVPHLRIRIH